MGNDVLWTRKVIVVMERRSPQEIKSNRVSRSWDWKGREAEG